MIIVVIGLSNLLPAPAPAPAKPKDQPAHLLQEEFILFLFFFFFESERERVREQAGQRPREREKRKKEKKKEKSGFPCANPFLITLSVCIVQRTILHFMYSAATQSILLAFSCCPLLFYSVALWLLFALLLSGSYPHLSLSLLLFSLYYVSPVINPLII